MDEKSLRELYSHIEARLARLCFGELYPNFHKFDFALYTSKHVLIDGNYFERDDRFFGNTSIDYDGRKIAIWNVEDDFDGDEDKLSADMVHEMFHAFQSECGEKRFPDDLKTLMYPLDPANFSLKFRENTLLSHAFAATDAAQKETLLSEFSAIRHIRQKKLSSMCECEYFSETIEGMAEYVGALALKSISPKKYVERTQKYSKILSELNDTQFDIRRISYYSGALFLLASHDMGIDICHPLSEAESAFELISRHLLPCTDSIEDAIDEDVLHAIEGVVLKRRAQLNDAIENSAEWIEGEYTIVGYDPMNMLREGDLLLCKTLVMLRGAGDTQTIFGKTLLKMKKDSAKIVKSFSKVNG